jgi:hypothetical protein
LPGYDARCFLISLDVLSARDILVGRVDCSDIALMLRLKEVPYSKRVRDLFQSCQSYGILWQVRTGEQRNNQFKKYCHWFGFCGEVGRDMFRDRLRSALSEESFGHRRLQ